MNDSSLHTLFLEYFLHHSPKKMMFLLSKHTLFSNAVVINNVDFVVMFYCKTSSSTDIFDLVSICMQSLQNLEKRLT